ncbi:MAG: endonuclease [Muribaculaceae bacterium]|nr:endonuclease [Muribaculaceae bacterium]
MNLRHITIALAAAAVCCTAAHAEAPAGYYNSLDGKKEGELKTAIHNRVTGFRLVSSYSALPDYFRVTDVYPESNRWWDMYSDIPLYAPSFKGLNREHSFPKSWWGGSTTVSAYVDLNHLYPSESAANMAKSNYPLGEVDRSSTVAFENGVSTVGYPVQGQGGGASRVFEPADEYKGDFARTYFYMVTCYQNLTWKWTYMVNQNVYPTLNNWSVQLLMKWHRDDPVSQKEIDRNDAVYSFQDNRNPFIDHPELAEYLWGDRVGEVFRLGEAPEPVGDAELETPVNGAVLEFGQVAEGATVTSKLLFKGTNIRGNLSLLIYRGDKDMFSIPVTTLTASQVNSEEGTWLTVSYKPTATGEHSARLLINGTGEDGNGSRGVELRGECLAKPVLSAPKATAATDITPTSYVANWTPAEGETVDYYIVTRTRYNDGLPTVEKLLAEDTSLLIEEFDLSDSESYTVRAVRLGVESPESNVVFVSHTGITDATADMPFEAFGDEGCIVVRSIVAVAPVRIYDVAGREVAYIAEVDGAYEIELPAGVYIVSAGRGTAPVKVSVR